MIKLPSANGTIIKSPARIRLERELVDLDIPGNIKILLIDYEALELLVRLYPDEGPFEGAQIDFEIKIPQMYPHRPPKARILQKLFHPNFDLEGHVCLNILRLDWNPVLPITSVFFGLLTVLLDPSGEEALNQGLWSIEAGSMIERDRDEYDRIARCCAMGSEHNGVKYDKIIQ